MSVISNRAIKVRDIAFLLYVGLTLLGVATIFVQDRLLGDFIWYANSPKNLDILAFIVLYNIPFFFIIGILRLCKKIQLLRPIPTIEDLAIALLIITTVAGYVFGLPRIGSEQIGNSILQSILGKINVAFLFLVVCSGSRKIRVILVGAVCMLVCSYLKTSLMNIFMIGVGMILYLNLHYSNSKSKKIILGLILGTIVYYFSIQIIESLYSMRDTMRGGLRFETSSRDVIAFFIGRINSVSSFIFIWESNCCLAPPSDFYIISQIFGPYVGIPFEGMNPTAVFNKSLLGHASNQYNIFTSLSGAFLIDYQNSLANFIITIIFFFLLIIFVYAVMPLKYSTEKVWFFSLVLYPFFLSGDFWEFRMFIESMIFTSILLRMMSAITARGKGKNVSLKVNNL